MFLYISASDSCNFINTSDYIMRTLTIAFFLILISTSLNAQDAELQQYKNELSRALHQKNNDSIATAYCHLGEYYAYRQADSARYYCEEGLKYIGRDTPQLYLLLLNNLADTYSATGEIDEAINRFFKVRDEALSLQCEDELLSTILTSIGVQYRRKAMPDSALVYYNRALELLENGTAYDEQAHLLTSMAILYANTSRLSEGELYARRAMEAAKKGEDIDMLIYAGSTAGGILALREKYSEGARMIHPALAKAREQHKPRFVLKSIIYLLNIFQKMNNNDSINHYMREAEIAMKELPATTNEVLGYQEALFKILTKMGRYRESLHIQQHLLETMGANFQTPLDKLYLAMAHNYDGLNEHLHASEYYNKAIQAADSLHQEQINTELSELSVKYETQEKELEIARLTREQMAQKAKTMQWGIIAAIAVSALLLFTLYYYFRRKRIRKEEELKLARSYIEGLERERTRLAKDLHDGVCNDLLGIGMQMQFMQPTVESRQELLTLLEQVRSDVRYISHELMPPKFQLATLAETVEDYVERISLPPSMQLSFSKENEGTEWSLIPEQVSYEVYRILQELLSNILKHSEATEVNVNLSLKEKRLALKIVNNGKGYVNVEISGCGIGLSTIQERAKAVGGIFTTTIQSGKQSYELDISLPI